MAAKLRLGFVPEQVNIPLHLCDKQGIFNRHGLDVSIHLIPEGTGRMLELIENEVIDIAFPVTDAFIVAKSKGRELTLLGTYAASPLIWSAVTGRSASFRSFHELRELNRPVTIAVSRLGSGSHTMGQYAASLHGLHDIRFHISNTFAGLRDDVNSGRADFFLWERFTTKPWVDRDELTLIGEVPTPWTAFSIVSKSEINTGMLLEYATPTVVTLVRESRKYSKTLSRDSRRNT